VLSLATRSRYNQRVHVDLRDFRRDDFEALWTIDQQCFPPGISYSRLELAAYIARRSSLTLVAEAFEVEVTAKARNGHKPSSATLGFVVAERRHDLGHIITIDVLPEWRRLGVGTTLLGACEARLKAQHCSSVVLETAVDNTAALSFYKRHQYHVIKTLPHYYSMGVDAFVLSKPLPGS
jgi:ribosomal-protein-alanine N-acetyltransferase